MMTKNNDVLLGMLAAAALISAVGLMYAPFATMLAALRRPMNVTSLILLIVLRRLLR